MKDIALILIDIQQGYDDIDYWGGERNNHDAEENCKVILEHFRQLKLPIFHIQHNSNNSASPLYFKNKGFAFKHQVTPLAGETIIVKQVNSAFIGTDLQSVLIKKKIKNLVIVGFTTDHCVSATSKMASDFRFNTIVVSDATASFNKIGINGDKYDAEIIHNTALASLKDKFTSVMNTTEVLRRIL